MSGLYLPKYKVQTAVDDTHCVINDARAGKPVGWEFISQYFTYERWERKDDDFVIFYGVVTIYELPEIVHTDYCKAVVPYTGADATHGKIAGYTTPASRVIGPIAAGARFDRMLMHRISREGILERISKNVYYISLSTDGSQTVPRLIGDNK
jgi:hypothetical protein